MKPLVFAFLGGLALLIGIRWVWPGLGGAMMAVAVAVGIVAALGWHYHRDPGRDRGRGGDDLYYLGLLFTLCSLIYTLVVLFLTDAGGTPARIEQLIGNFGIALFSTVAGILGRILLQSGAMAAERPQPTRQIDLPLAEWEQANKEAMQFMLALRRQLREASDAFGHFTRVTLSHGERVQAHTERLIEDFNRNMEASAKRHLDNTNTVWQETAAQMAAATERMLRQIDEHTAAATRRTEAAWEQVAQAADAAVTAVRLRLDEKGEQAQELLQHLATANRALNALGSGVVAVQANVVELGKEAAQAATSVKDQGSAITEAQRAFADATRSVHTTTADALAGTAGNMAKLRDSLGEQVRLWQSAVQDFATATAAERDRQQRAAATFEELVAGVAKARDDFDAFSETMQTMKDTATDFSATVRVVSDHLAEMNTMRRPRRLGWLTNLLRRDAQQD